MISLKDKRARLASYHPRPEDGEEIPINFIDMEEKLAGWVPELKRTIYLDKSINYDHERFKRVREVHLLKVYNWILEGISIIELNHDERMQFEDTVNDLLLYGGEIRYTRKKQGKKITNHFSLSEAPLQARAKMIELAEIL